MTDYPAWLPDEYQVDSPMPEATNPVSVADVLRSNVDRAASTTTGNAVDVPAPSKTWDEMSVIEKIRAISWGGVIADTAGVGRPGAPTPLSAVQGAVSSSLSTVLSPISGPLVLIGIIAIVGLMLFGRIKG